MIVTLKEVLQKAHNNNYAVGAFNINNMEILQAVVSAAEKLKSPVIVQTSEGAIKYAGLDMLYHMVNSISEFTSIPIVLHLDHGQNLETVKHCIKIGYSSVMFDGSHLEFEKNVKLTKQVVQIAHKEDISVEGELGTIGGAEDLLSARKILYTDPEAAKEFVEKTNVDALAVAIGTSHGAYKFNGKANLDINRLKEINKKVKIPLVLHGASGVPDWLVKEATKYGARLGKPEGVPESQIKQAIKNGVDKINTDTDLRLAFDAAVRKVLREQPSDFDPRHVLAPARELIQKVVEHRIKLFGSAGKSK